MKHAAFLFGLLILFVVRTQAQDGTVVFSDAFEEDLSAQYTLVQHAPDTSMAEFAFDYSTVTLTDGSTIPEVPRSKAATGLELHMTASRPGGVRDALSLYTNMDFAGDYQVIVDVFPAVIDGFGSPSRDRYHVGINHSGSKVINWIQDFLGDPETDLSPDTDGFYWTASSNGTDGGIDSGLLEGIPNSTDGLSNAACSVWEFPDAETGNPLQACLIDPTQTDLFIIDIYIDAPTEPGKPGNT